jgi:anhydro-N-acetylmuramic acid kinase
MKDRLVVLGAMTGTSCDALDAACIEIDGQGWAPLWSASRPYPPALRKRVLAAQRPGSRWSALEWLVLERDLGEWYGRALRDCMKGRTRPDLIANHGQTVSHFPQDGVTLQMGEPTRIAHATGVTVASGFRAGDMAAGGQGAPLAPLFHQLLAQALMDPAHSVAIHNLGGISNLTYLGPKNRTLAFDTGPANIWIDAATEKATRCRRKFDEGGKLAAVGVPDARAVERAMKHPFFVKKPPKSTGRDDFALEEFFKLTRAKGADLVATATEITARSIAQAYQDFIFAKKLPLTHIYFCGGGAKNKTLLLNIAEKLPQVKVEVLERKGLHSQLIEPQAFAFFGFLSLLGQPLGGSWTGVKSFGPPAQLVPGENWTELLAKLHQIQSRL